MGRMPRWFLCAALLGTDVASAQTFRYATSGDIITLEPHSGNEAVTNSFKNNIYEGLVRFDADTWRFRLRQGVTFHDGTPLTADDVVFSFKRQKSKNSGNPDPLSTVKE